MVATIAVSATAAAATPMPNAMRCGAGRPSTAPNPPCERVEARLIEESTEPTESQEPVEKAEQAEPTEQIEQKEPTEPIESTDPSEAIERNEGMGLGRCMLIPKG